MLKPKSPLTITRPDRPKSGRKPLQPKNSPANIPIHNNNISPKITSKWIEISPADDSNKENQDHLRYSTPVKFESFDSSLAEELSAIRQKLERMRLDREKTEKMLRERDLVLETKLKEVIRRGEVQKQLEIEVDRLFRLKELKCSTCVISPIRSLREKKQGSGQKTRRAGQSQDTNDRDSDESNYDCNSSSMKSPLLESHTHKDK